jgi:hypothetical protein
MEASMGLLKKKPDEIALPDATEEPPAPGGPEPEDDSAELTEALFAAPPSADDADADSPDEPSEDPAEAVAPPAAVQTVEIKEETSDALLNVFESMQSEMEDRSLLLEIVGDVDIASLSEELRTTAAALGILRGRKHSGNAS